MSKQSDVASPNSEEVCSGTPMGERREGKRRKAEECVWEGKKESVCRYHVPVLIQGPHVPCLRIVCRLVVAADVFVAGGGGDDV